MLSESKNFPEVSKDSSALPVGARWGTKKVKFLASLQSDKSPMKGTIVALENIESNTGKLLDTEASYSGESVKFLAGDVLFGKLRPYLRKVFISNFEGFSFGDILVFRPVDIVPKFLFYIFISDEFINCVEQATYGTKMPRANPEFIQNIGVPAPPTLEQQKIAQFLDYETAKIDALIDEQKRLIELLKEKRQAVISHAVTKGLNPDVPMKDSGVEWLGDVPAHWVAGKIKHLAKVISKGTTPSTLGGDFEDKGVRFIKAENVGKSISVSTSPEFFISEEVDELLKRSRLQESDVLVIIAGATTGKASVITDELLPANTNQAVSFIRPTSSIYSKWIALSMGLSSTQNEIQLTSVQSAQPNLSMEDLGNLSILIPPQSEVSDIIRYLEKSTKKIDILMAESERLMKLQVERRSALISAAVTGKIDVRDWQPPEDADLIDSNAAVQMERQDG